MLERVGFAGELSLGGELERAVEDADYVLVQIRVGGQAARLHDETAPASVRLHRPGDDRGGRVREGDADGAGRARDRRSRRELAGPDAWIVDFTNPVGIVTRALLDAGHRAVGLCNVAITCNGAARRCSASSRRESSSTRSVSTT